MLKPQPLADHREPLSLRWSDQMFEKRRLARCSLISPSNSIAFSMAVNVCLTPNDMGSARSQDATA
jgi:hypothetical protein